jgi:hypothetical protein
MNNVGFEPVDAWSVLYALRTIVRPGSARSKELPSVFSGWKMQPPGLGSQWQRKYLPLVGRAVSRDVGDLTKLQAAVAGAH